jgi:hypothetical protein
MNPKPSSSRRKFLATIGAGGAAAAVAAVGQQTVQPQLNSEPATGSGKGYQVTEHVRNYYRTTKI